MTQTNSIDCNKNSGEYFPSKLNSIIKKYPIISKFHYFKSLDSTNEHAQNEIRKNIKMSNSLIIADYQKAGQGRRNNVWDSEPNKNLLMSWVITPDCSIDKWPLITFPLSIALKDGLSKLLPNTEIQLKWPNDILINHKKCIGILAKSEMKHCKLVIGIGVNIDEPAQMNRTSINDESHVKYDRWDVLDALLSALNQHKAEILTATVDSISWNNSAAYIGKQVNVSADTLITGINCGINDKGALMLETPSGQKEIFHGHGLRPLH